MTSQIEEGLHRIVYGHAVDYFYFLAPDVPVKKRIFRPRGPMKRRTGKTIGEISFIAIPTLWPRMLSL